MGEQKDPNLTADETGLTTALGKLTVLLAIFFGKTNTFVEAVLNGVSSVSNTQVVSLKNIIDAAFDIVIRIATLIGFTPFIHLAMVAKYYYDDIATGGSVSLLQLIRALAQSRKPTNEAVAQAKEKATDPTLGADELSLATQLGALVKLIALYLGAQTNAADNKAEIFMNAFMTGIGEVDETVTVTLKNVVDGAFAVITYLAAIINNTILKLVVSAVVELYDDFAGNKTGLIAIWEALSAKKAIILKKANAPVAQPAAAAVTEAK